MAAHEALEAVLADDRDVVEVICGGKDTVDIAARYIAPTVLRCNGFGEKAFEEEIFGPILPVVRVANIDAAVAHVNDGKPRCTYVQVEFHMRRCAGTHIVGRCVR